MYSNGHVVPLMRPFSTDFIHKMFIAFEEKKKKETGRGF